ncbi:lipoate-protein ligase A [Deinobacterium chartae]|uniref:Lipoate-protein ligase A n=1 Tax=Deinobacterium chartae TaxID=521158 RepID=A0A841I1Y3_9DEIO|nr:biotin/lipoate A/B protein ligase family protein [Deinobacterium chartae]MBB6098994.1 lipoate-protein ligase A [Deinobacterium chartae]
MTRTTWRDYEWELIHGGPQSGTLHMALDELLTQQVGEGRRAPTLRIWEWGEPAVVLGRFQSVRNEVDPEGARKHGMRVVRRITGGGAMFVEPGNTITYSIYAPPELVQGMSFVDSYAFLDAWTLEALRSLGVKASYAPINDITSEGGKIGGAAQSRRFGAVLHHVTMAYDMNPAKMLEVLRIGKEKLSDKGNVSANKRVGPLRQQTDLPRETIIGRMVDTFRERHGLRPGTLSASDLEEAEERVRQKFGTDDWIYLLP